MTDLDIKVKSLNRRLKDTDVLDQLEQLQISQTNQIQAVQETFAGIRGTELEGLPATIALMRSKLMSDRMIADELDIPMKAVRKYSQVPGFQTLLHQLQSATWSDLIIASQATLLFHISVNRDLDAAKWLLERTGQVASNQPLTTNQTLILNGQPNQQTNDLKQIASNGPIAVEQLAEAFYKRSMENQASIGVPAPVISE